MTTSCANGYWQGVSNGYQALVETSLAQNIVGGFFLEDVYFLWGHIVDSVILLTSQRFDLEEGRSNPHPHSQVSQDVYIFNRI